MMVDVVHADIGGELAQDAGQVVVRAALQRAAEILALLNLSQKDQYEYDDEHDTD